MTLEEVKAHREYYDYFRELNSVAVYALLDFVEAKLKEGEITLTPVGEKPKKIKTSKTEAE